MLAGHHLYTEADVGYVKIDRDDRAEHDKAANGVLHKRDAAAPPRLRVVAVSLQQRNTRVQPDREGHLVNDSQAHEEKQQGKRSHLR